jgi:hypothetical protein
MVYVQKNVPECEKDAPAVDLSRLRRIQIWSYGLKNLVFIMQQNEPD